MKLNLNLYEKVVKTTSDLILPVSRHESEKLIAKAICSHATNVKNDQVLALEDT
jgi:hypothetical protein